MLKRLEIYYRAYLRAAKAACLELGDQIEGDRGRALSAKLAKVNVSRIKADDLPKPLKLVRHHVQEPFPTIFERCLESTLVREFIDYVCELTVGETFRDTLVLFSEEEAGVFDEVGPEDKDAAAVEAIQGFLQGHRKAFVEFFNYTYKAKSHQKDKPNTLQIALRHYLAALKTFESAYAGGGGIVPDAIQREADRAERQMGRCLKWAAVAYKYMRDEAEEAVHEGFSWEGLEHFPDWATFFRDFIVSRIAEVHKRILGEALYSLDMAQKSGNSVLQIQIPIEPLTRVYVEKTGDEYPLLRTKVQQEAELDKQTRDMYQNWIIRYSRTRLQPFKSLDKELDNIIRVMHMFPVCRQYHEAYDLYQEELKERARKGLSLFKKSSDSGSAENDEQDVKALEEVMVNVGQAIDDVFYCYDKHFFMDAVRRVFNIRVKRPDGKVFQVDRVAHRVELLKKKRRYTTSLYKWMLQRIVHMHFYDIFRNIKGRRASEYVHGLKEDATFEKSYITVEINLSEIATKRIRDLRRPKAYLSPTEKVRFKKEMRRELVGIAAYVCERIFAYLMPDWRSKLAAKGVKGFLQLLTAKVGTKTNPLLMGLINLDLVSLLKVEVEGADASQKNLHLIQEALRLSADKLHA